MSIETEITRISTNVSDTLSAVSEMGGEVPEGATSNDMAAGVRSIPVGAKIDDTTPSSTTVYSSQKIESVVSALNEAKVNKTGWTAGKYLGTDDGGNVVEKDAPTGVESGAYVSPLSGKRLSILGDSISTYAGYIPDGYATYYSTSNLASVDDTWWKKLIDATGMELCVNNSYSGTRVAVTSWLGDYAGCLFSRNMALHNGETIPDVIIVAMGCNDYNNEIAVGSYSPTQGVEFDTSKFTDAYAQTLYYITKKYPSARVFCATCAASEKNAGTDGPEINGNGLSFSEFNGYIRDIAAVFNCGVIDFEQCGITHENLSYVMQDGIQHPNAYGHSLMANEAISIIDPSNPKRYESIAPTMRPAASGVTLDQTALDLISGRNATLKATVTPSNAVILDVEWSTSNSGVATVDAGKVQAVGVGDATITVKTVDGGFSAQCAVTVSEPAVSDVQVTSLTSAVGQYIDTGYVPTVNTKIEMDFSIDSMQSWTDYPFGCSSFRIKSVNITSNFRPFILRDDKSTSAEYDVSYGNPATRSILAASKAGIIKDGNALKTSIGAGSVVPTLSMYLFGIHTNEGLSDSSTKCTYTIYGLKIYESDELVKDFVPYVDSSGIGCMKETISGELYYDATGGSFDYVV